MGGPARLHTKNLPFRWIWCLRPALVARVAAYDTTFPLCPGRLALGPRSRTGGECRRVPSDIYSYPHGKSERRSDRLLRSDFHGDHRLHRVAHRSTRQAGQCRVIDSDLTDSCGSYFDTLKQPRFRIDNLPPPAANLNVQWKRNLPKGESKFNDQQEDRQRNSRRSETLLVQLLYREMQGNSGGDSSVPADPVLHVVIWLPNQFFEKSEWQGRLPQGVRPLLLGVYASREDDRRG